MTVQSPERFNKFAHKRPPASGRLHVSRLLLHHLLPMAGHSILKPPRVSAVPAFCFQ